MHFSFAILVHVVVATHYYASWPFDDLADPADDGSDVYREVDAECWPSLILCKWDRDWMPPVQQHATEAFSVCSLILVIVMTGIIILLQGIFLLNHHLHHLHHLQRLHHLFKIQRKMKLHLKNFSRTYNL